MHKQPHSRTTDGIGTTMELSRRASSAFRRPCWWKGFLWDGLLGHLFGRPSAEKKLHKKCCPHFMLRWGVWWDFRTLAILLLLCAGSSASLRYFVPTADRAAIRTSWRKQCAGLKRPREKLASKNLYLDRSVRSTGIHPARPGRGTNNRHQKGCHEWDCNDVARGYRH